MGLTLTYPRRFDTSDFTVLTAAVKVLEGACTCSVIASGLATGGAFSNATHRFCGFALDTAQAGQRLRLKNKGRTLLTVTGASAAKANAVVYASDDNTFTVTPASGEVAIGRIAWVEEGEKAVVDFDASIEAGQVGTQINTGGSVILVGPDGTISLGTKSARFRRGIGAGTVIADCSTATGYTKSQQGGTSTLAVAAVPAGGPRSSKGSSNLLRLTNDTVSMWTALEKAVTAQINPAKRTDWWFYFPDYTEIANLTLYLATDATYTNYYSVTVTPYTFNGWQCFTVADTEWVTIGSPTFDTITKVKFRATPVAGAAVDIMWDRAVYSPSGIPQIALIFDDGQDTDYKWVFPMAAKYGLSVSFATIADLIGTSNFCTWDQLRQMRSAGHDIIVHGQYGLDSLGSLAAATADIEHNQTTIAANVPDAASNIYVFPQGIYQMAAGDTSLIDYLASAGFRCAFLAGSRSRVVQDAYQNRYIIERAKIDSATVAATWLADLDVALNSGRSYVSVGHVVVASGATTTQTNYAVLDAIFAGIASRQDAGKCISVTASQFAENLGL